MSKTIYNMGYTAGRSCAELCPNSVREAKLKQTLGILAGKKLDAIRQRGNQRSDDFYVKTDTWATGFWEGFMDKAELL